MIFVSQITFVKSPTPLITFFFFFFLILFFLIMTIPLFSSWWIISKPRNYYIYVVSSMFVLLFSSFDTFHVKWSIYVLAKLQHQTVLVLSVTVGKIYFTEHREIC